MAHGELSVEDGSYPTKSASEALGEGGLGPMTGSNGMFRSGGDGVLGGPLGVFRPDGGSERGPKTGKGGVEASSGQKHNQKTTLYFKFKR